MSSTDYFKLAPDASLDFGEDWSAWLAPTEHIVTATATATPGVQVGTVTNIGGVVTVWLSNGELGKVSTVTIHIVTDVGREDDRSFDVKVVERRLPSP